jgi:L-ribulose-5-phosphate 3-epimerase
MSTIIPKIGIMQGRLSEPVNNQIQSFPHNTWETEFEKAHNCGFQVLEWIFDDLENPILNDSQIEKIKSLSSEYDIEINSICADYFMKEKLFDVSDSQLKANFSVLKNLILRCSKIGIKILEIPLVDSSSIKNIEHRNQFIQNLTQFLPQIDSNIIINLETDLPPLEFKILLEQFKDFQICVNYDIGNSTSLGYSVDEEISILKSKIKNIHVKDRIFQGKTVPLGTGDVDFELFFQNLAQIQYDGDLIIQGARSISNTSDPVIVSKKYYQFVNQYVDKYLK